MELKAIITGDIISSRSIRAELRQQLYTDLDKFLGSIKKKWIANYETYRGDSFQCELIRLEKALSVALMIKAYIISYSSPKAAKITRSITKGYSNKEFDIRIAAGIGGIDFINKKKITTSDGEAFRLSGEALDKLKHENQTIVIKTNNEALNKSLAPLIALVDALTQKWTQNQAELILAKLMGKGDDEIAAEIDITTSAITQRKKTANWLAIEKAIIYVEEQLKTYDTSIHL